MRKLIALVALTSGLAVSQVTYTQITGSLLRADGTPYQGTATVAWQTFTDPSGNVNPAGKLQLNIINGVPLTANGGIPQLVPNSQWIINGTCVAPTCVLSYVVSYTFSNGQPMRVFWVVPVSSTPVNINTITSASGGAEGPNAVVALTQLAQGGAGLNYCLAWNGNYWSPSNSCGAGGNHPGGTNGQIQFNNAGNFGGFTPGGDVTFSRPNFTVVSTNGVPFAPSATTNALNASNISSGTLATAVGGTGAGTLTQGSVVFAGASGIYGQDNGNLFWDSANHRLGVGKSTPNFTLDVFATGSQNTPLNIQSGPGLNTNFSMIDGNNTNGWSLAANTSGQFSLYDATNNKEVFVVDPNGVNGAMRLFSSGDFVIGQLPGDNGYRLDVQKSGSSGTSRFFDQTASTGVTTVVFQNGAGQSTTDLVQFKNSTGTELGAVLYDGTYFGRQFVSVSTESSGVGSSLNGSYGAGLQFSNSRGACWSSDTNWYDSQDTGIFRNAAGVVEIDNCTTGVYRDLVLRNITINGTCTGSGCGGGGGGAGAPPYTLCASGCSSTIPSSGSTIAAATHGQGATAFGYALDSGGNEIFPPNFSITNNGSGLLIITYVTAPSKITIYGATGGFANPMTTAGDLIVGGASGAASRIPIGTNGYVLTVSGGTAAWAAPVTVPAYTLCASGCSQTIPSSPFTITASVHGLGANAIAVCFDNATPHNMMSPPNCSATEATLNGDIVFSYTTAPSKIVIR